MRKASVVADSAASSPDAAPDALRGYSEVDDQRAIATVLSGMDATAAWPSVRQLRVWEHKRLAVRCGDRVLDVGCGLGDVAAALARDVVPGGQVVAVDASAAMLDVAARRASEAGVEVDFRTGDAMALNEPSDGFDACRSERMLQWLPDPGGAIDEMVRVLRPGGRLSLIDTDWRTLTIDLPDTDAVSAFCEAIWMLRGAPASAGSQMLNLCRHAGLIDLEATAASHVWTHWDPETEEAPAGLFPLVPVVKQMIEADQLDPAVGERFLSDLVRAGETDRFFMSIGMFAVFGRRPEGKG